MIVNYSGLLGLNSFYFCCVPHQHRQAEWSDLNSQIRHQLNESHRTSKGRENKVEDSLQMAITSHNVEPSNVSILFYSLVIGSAVNRKTTCVECL
jgi:hypothetical protein